MENFMCNTFVIGDISFANIIKANPGSKVHKNRKHHGLALFLGGDRTFCFDRTSLHVKGDTIVYFPQGSDYVIRQEAPSDCYAINFEIVGGASFAPFSFRVKNTGVYLESFKQAQRCQMRKHAGYDAEIKSALYRIISHMQAEYALPYAQYKVIEPALQYIHARYLKETISVEHLASLCGISSVYLRNLFVKKFTVSPIKYIHDLKMARAKELLSSQFYTVSEACLLAGYNDESYFSREFKKHFHITPSEFKKQSENE